MAKNKGGKREGAGRKNTGRILVSMRLDPIIMAKARKIGKGSVRDGVTLAIEWMPK